ncbi:hypothetical protein NE865_16293 [Phthorimaea operculella]|nr:hypothetical protein NE865_16293 [Phthorimaea operculella]
MVVYFVIAGKTQCEDFAEVCLIADYLSQELPNFCYERIEKYILEWTQWLRKTNIANNWHHIGSPIIWKELQMKGSKPFYIGGISQFLEYVHSYYNFDFFMGYEKFHGLIKNFGQYKKKLKEEFLQFRKVEQGDTNQKDDYAVCITGASSPMTAQLLAGLVDLAYKGPFETEVPKYISKIFLYDDNCSEDDLKKIEAQCSFITANYPGKVVKYADKIGNALTISDLLIVLDHEPFDPSKSIGEWLHANMRLMRSLAIMINASASRSIFILFPNIGPACFNATVLMHFVTINIRNIIVATSDLGFETLDTISEVCDLPVRKMFCPPVWGFVGINHLVDIKTGVHEYNSFEPYSRYTRVKNSTLNIGVVTPEVRTLEYLTYFDDTIWVKVAEKKKQLPIGAITLNKTMALLNLIRVWLIEPADAGYIVSLGLLCDGTFGLTFDGCFSQPARLVGRQWRPAEEYFMPKDNFILRRRMSGWLRLNNRNIEPIAWKSINLLFISERIRLKSCRQSQPHCASRTTGKSERVSATYLSFKETRQTEKLRNITTLLVRSVKSVNKF